ncbi:MAG: tetratricopeptide repeat protein [Bryobacteraceae bacterium]
MPSKSVFISHSSKDDAIIRELRQALSDLGVETWADSERLSGGDSLTAVIREEIANADYFLVLVSRDSMESEWVEREIAHAKSLGKRIVPLTIGGVGGLSVRRLLSEELVRIPLDNGAGAIGGALPQILAAIGEHPPAETIRHVQAQSAPPADLVLELTDPAIEEFEGKRRAIAVARLVFTPPESREMESQRYRFTSPLGPIEAGEIEWYLERFVNWPAEPFLERAHNVEQALPEWGRQLYDSVNAEPARAVLDAWSAAGAAERRFTVKVDRQLIAGTPPEKQKEADEAATLLLGLPWELIHDQQGYLFQGARPVRVRRGLPNGDRQRAVATEPPIRVLLVSPRPEDESAAYIDHRISARPLVEALSRLGHLASLRLLETPTFPALEKELQDARERGEPYHVVHFDGHGVYDRTHNLGKLCFEEPSDADKLEGRRSQLIDADRIARMVRDHRIPLFFLEACQTAQADRDPSASVAARLLESGVASVAAMTHSVLVETASRFISQFYRGLLQGKRVGQAMLAGQRALKSDTFRDKTFTGELHLEDWFVPVLFQEEQDPQLVREVPGEQVAAIIEKRRELALGQMPKEPGHRFLGRSRDLLKAERMLAGERYIVVQGSGGEGKTTFAAELARWLVATQRYRHAAFTSVEQLTEARQVLFSLGEQLIPNFLTRVGTDDEHGCQLLEQFLAEQKTVLAIDNVESILPGPGSAGQEACATILKLCDRLGKAGGTRMIFTSREALPAPFDKNVLRIVRLDRDTAIRVLSNLLPEAPKAGATEDDLRNLVDTVGGHARSLVLIAREVGAAGVRRATENLREVLQAMETKHPGERENSVLASAELSLRRLPAAVRQSIGPLSVFYGGGSLATIAIALELEGERVGELARTLIGVGLAEYVEPSYLRFDPALFGVELGDGEREKATAAWAEATRHVIRFLHGQQFEDANLANNLTLLELPNFLAALEHFAKTESADEVVVLANPLESLVSTLNRPKVLARIVEIRSSAAQRLSGWSHSQYLTERASIERLIEQGRLGEAIRAAYMLQAKFDAVADLEYEGAAYDLATAEATLGRALRLGGNAQAALPHLESAHRRFVDLNEPRMLGVALTDRADCLRDLGRYDEAAEAYQQIIAMEEKRNNPRDVAVSKMQLATVWRHQNKNTEALKLYNEARELFEQLNEPALIASAWHGIGNVYSQAGQYDAAEVAYQKVLGISIGTGDRRGQGASLNQLGILYAKIGRLEEAVRIHRQSAEVYVELGDLRMEGLARNNAANELIKLRRFDEARRELERAIECKKPFGHAAEPWTTFGILRDLENAVGDERFALAARQQAIEAYLAYRRDGGAPQIDPAPLIALVKQDPVAVRAAVDDPEILYRVAAEVILALGQRLVKAE